MFTGPVEQMGEVRKAGARLAVATPLTAELERGDPQLAARWAMTCRLRPHSGGFGTMQALQGCRHNLVGIYLQTWMV